MEVSAGCSRRRRRGADLVMEPRVVVGRRGRPCLARAPVDPLGEGATLPSSQPASAGVVSAHQSSARRERHQRPLALQVEVGLLVLAFDCIWGAKRLLPVNFSYF